MAAQRDNVRLWVWVEEWIKWKRKEGIFFLLNKEYLTDTEMELN